MAAETLRFVGGPLDGETRAVDRPPYAYRVARPAPPRWTAAPPPPDAEIPLVHVLYTLERDVLTDERRYRHTPTPGDGVTPPWP